MLDKAVATANKKLIEAGDVPLPDGLTPHLRVWSMTLPGSTPRATRIGHADPGFTLRVYRHGMRRDGAAKERLRALVGGADWAGMGSSEAQTPWTRLAASTGRSPKTA